MQILYGLLCLIGALAVMFVVIVVLPQRIRVWRIGFKYGWPRQKREQIRKLFENGTLTSIGYTGATYDRQMFVLSIVGPWGDFYLATPEIKPRFVRGCTPLPPQVAAAFDGYCESVSDIVYLLWDFSFMEQMKRLEGKKLHVCGSPTTLVIAPI